MSEASIPGEFPTSAKAKKQADRNRVCAYEACKTVLSAYNPTERCSLHPKGRVRVHGTRIARKAPQRTKEAGRIVGAGRLPSVFDQAEKQTGSRTIRNDQGRPTSR